MKDNRFPNLVIQDPTAGIKTTRRGGVTREEGRLDLKPRVLAHYNFDYPEPGEFQFTDNSGKLSGMGPVRGIVNPSATQHELIPNPVQLSELSSVNPNLVFVPNVGVNSRRVLPSGLIMQGPGPFTLYPFGNDNAFLFQPEARSLLPSSPGDTRTFHIRMLIGPSGVRLNKALLSFAETTSSNAFFTVGFTSQTSATVIFHDTSTAPSYKQQDIPLLHNSASTNAFGKLVDLFVTPKLDGSGNAALDFGYSFTDSGGAQSHVTVASEIAGTHPPINGGDGTIYGQRPGIFMGYGELTGGVNTTFGDDDYINGIFGVSLSVYKGRLTEKEMKALCRGLSQNEDSFMYRSGIESEPVRQTLRRRDQARSYPSSKGRYIGDSRDTSSDPFNETHAIDFVKQPVVYPEMIPLSMYSGSVAHSKTIKGDGGDPTAEATIAISGYNASHFNGRRFTLEASNGPAAATTLAVFEFDTTVNKAAGGSSGSGNNADPYKVGIQDVITPTTSATLANVAEAVTTAINTSANLTNKIRARRSGTSDVILKQVNKGIEGNTRPTLPTGTSPAILSFLQKFRMTNFTGGEQGKHRGSGGIEYLPKSGDASNSSDHRGFQISSQHHTPLDKRLILEVTPNERSMHTDSFRFQRFTANERLIKDLFLFYQPEENPSRRKKFQSIGNRNPLQRAPSVFATYAYSTGSIQPFDESRVSSDAAIIDRRAVSVGVAEGFDHKLGEAFTIEIPLNPESSTTFGVDKNNNFSMGYFNFKDSKWDAVGQIPGVSGSLITDFQPDGVSAGEFSACNWQGLMASSSLGFAGTSGFAIYPENGSDALSELKYRGAPTAVCGFPIDRKYKASDNQLLDMSKYIDSPFVLERWEIQFEAEVEESGPESLGYVMPTRTEMGDFSRFVKEGVATLGPEDILDRMKHLHLHTQVGHIGKDFYGYIPYFGAPTRSGTTGSVDFVPSSPGVYWPGSRVPGRTGARAAIKFTSILSVGDEISLTSADNDQKTYTAAAATTTAANEFSINVNDPDTGVPTVRSMIEEIRGCVNDVTNGHGGKLFCQGGDFAVSTDFNTAFLVIDQLVAGAAGNTTVTVKDPSSNDVLPAGAIESFQGGSGNTTAFRLVEEANTSTPGADKPTPRPSSNVTPPLNTLVVPSGRHAVRRYECSSSLGMTGSISQESSPMSLVGIHNIPHEPSVILSGNVGCGAPPDIFRGLMFKGGMERSLMVGPTDSGSLGGALSSGFNINRGFFLGSSPTHNVAGVPDGATTFTKMAPGTAGTPTATSGGGASVPRNNPNMFTPYFRPSLYITGALYPAGEAGYYYLNSGTMLPHAGDRMLSGSTYAEGGAKYPVLFSGLNGLPTGSTLGITKHRENVSVSESSGVPFWRCDTFFLLRQHVTDELPDSINDRIKTQLAGTRTRNAASPGGSFAAPPAGGLGGNSIKTSNGSGAQKVANHEPQNISVAWSYQKQQPAVINSQVQKELGQSLWFPQVVDTSPPLTRSTPTTREMITYSQMTTYGYTAASSFESGRAVTQAIKVGNTAKHFVELSDTTVNLFPTRGGTESGGYGVNITNEAKTVQEALRTDTTASYATSVVNGSNVPYAGNQGPAVCPVTTSSIAFGGGSIVNAPGIIVGSGSHDHWQKYGTFHSSGLFHDGPLQGPIVGLNKNSPASVSSWLDAGLGRDLNVHVRPNQGTKKVFQSIGLAFRDVPGNGFFLDETQGGGVVAGTGNAEPERAIRGGFVFRVKNQGTARTGGRYSPDSNVTGSLYRIWFKNGAGSDSWTSTDPGTGNKSDQDTFIADYNYGIDAGALFGVARSALNITALNTALKTAFGAIGKTATAGPRVGLFPAVNTHSESRDLGDQPQNSQSKFANGGIILSASQAHPDTEFEIVYAHPLLTERILYISTSSYASRSLNFTVLTASIQSHAPTNLNGHLGTAAAPLGAYLYQKNILSSGSFTVRAPVRKASNSVRGAPTFFSTWTVRHKANPSTPFTSASTMAERRTLAFLDVPFTPGVKRDGIPSGRNYAKTVGADTLTTDNSFKMNFRFGNGTFGDPKNSADIPDDYTLAERRDPSFSKPGSQYTQLSSSAGSAVSNESLYVLLPEDKLILGFQPAQHGGNPGNPRPINPNIRPFSTRDHATPVGREANTADKMMSNIETPYEAAHSFKMKKGKAKLVLYGTLVTDRKPRLGTGRQELVSNEVHQAIVGDGPVIDQLSVNSLGEYSGSYLQNYISGSTSLRQLDAAFGQSDGVYARGVKLTAFEGNLDISGSFKRYVNLVDQSELHFDSLLPNFNDILKNKGSRPTFQKNALKDFGRPGFDVALLNFSAEYNGQYIDTETLATSDPGLVEATRSAIETPKFNVFSSWTTSFPFEEKWGEAERMTVITPNLGLEGVNGSLISMPCITFGVQFSSPQRKQHAAGYTKAEISASGSLSAPTTSSAFFPWHANNYNRGTDATTGAPASAGSYPGGFGGFEERAVCEPISVKMAEGDSPFVYRSAGTRADAATVNPNHSVGRFFSTPVVYGGINAPDVVLRGGGSLADELAAFYTRRTKTKYAIAAGFWQGRMCVSGSPSILNTVTTLTRTGDPTKPYQTALTGALIYAQIDHPSGWKYGLSNCRPTATKAQFRPDRYGQFRDMLEQRLFTKFFDNGLSENVRGKTDSPISCIFVDADGLPVLDPAETTCGNISTAMTSSRPFIEGDPRERIITSEYVSVT